MDFLIDASFDVTSPAVQQGLDRVLPECHLGSAAIVCSMQS